MADVRVRYDPQRRLPSMTCSACRGPYHPATGHRHSDKTVLCGPCARDWLKFFRGHVNRRWGKMKFYDYAVSRTPKDG